MEPCAFCGQKHTDQTLFTCRSCGKVVCTAQVSTLGPFFPYTHNVLLYWPNGWGVCGPVWKNATVNRE